MYSLVNKSKQGSDRNRMDVDGTLSSIIRVKLGRPESVKCCYQYESSQQVLELAKKATTVYDAEHSNK